MWQHAILTLCLLSTLSCLSALAAETWPCSDPRILITAPEQSERQLACEAAESALALMRRYGMQLPPRIEIEMKESGAELHAGKYFGQFNPFEDRISVISSTAVGKQAAQMKPFGQPMSPALHRSFIVHEVAHAVAEWNFKVAEPGCAAHEYLAYVFQIESMPMSLKRTILQAIDVPPFEAAVEISELYYRLNPDFFAVKAYRHFVRSPDRKKLIQRILAGEFID